MRETQANSSSKQSIQDDDYCKAIGTIGAVQEAA